MPSRGIRIFLAVIVIGVLVTGAFSGGILIGWLLPDRQSTNTAESAPDTTAESPTPGSGEVTTSTSDVNELFEPFWEAWDIVHENYVDQPVDDLALMRGAISGMISALGDPHSSYMDPEEFQELNTSLEGEYNGIGAYVDTDAPYLTIISPIPGSPAEAAGLKSGDQVIAIDGEDMTGVDAELARKKVLGQAGTEVVLTILREGETEPFDVTITRAHITVPSVTSEMLDNGIAYVALSDFGANTADELHSALETLLEQNPKGLILDLRYNPGGYLSTAVDVASEFIDSGVILYEESGTGERQEYDSHGGGIATEIPLVVLVNEGSASASEILAGAIQDYGRGQLVGVTTYGKGSVQMPIELENSQGVVRITIARWLTPNGRQIMDVGLTPDVVVELTEADINAGNDAQLNKAIELLQQGQ